MLEKTLKSIPIGNKDPSRMYLNQVRDVDEKLETFAHLNLNNLVEGQSYDLMVFNSKYYNYSPTEVRETLMSTISQESSRDISNMYVYIAPHNKDKQRQLNNMVDQWH